MYAEAEIGKVITQYIDAIRLGQPDLLSGLFHEKSVFSSPTDGDILIYHDPAKQFARYLTSRLADTSYNASFRAEIGRIDVHGAVASVLVREYGLGGSDFVSLFIFNRQQGGWIITASSSGRIEQGDSDPG